MPGKRIIDLPFGIPVTGADYFEVSQLIGGIQTSVKVPFSDLSPSLGLNEIGFGDQTTGALTSNSLFKRDPISGFIGMNTNNPLAQLHVVAPSGQEAMTINSAFGTDTILTWDSSGNTGKRHKQYIDNTLQTMNFYTKNNDTIFWNGNGFAQVKTLSLFYDTKAKFESELNIGAGDITLRELNGFPTIGAIYMQQSPTPSNYKLAGTNAGATYLNGDTLNYSINGSVKGSTNASYTQYLQPFAVGTIAPSGSNAFVVQGETFIKGSGSSSATYSIKGQDSIGNPTFNVLDNGFIGGKTIPAYPIDLQGWYGTNNEQVSFFSGYNIGMGGTTITHRNAQPSGQPWRFQNAGVDGIGISAATAGVLGLHVGDVALANQGGALTIGWSLATTNLINAYNALGTSQFKVRQDGFVITKANNAAFVSASLAASEMVSYINEATDELIFKVKYSDGVTVKTTSLPLI